MARVSTFLLSAVSVMLTSLTVGNAFFQKKQFYPSVVYITKSSPSMAVMYIQALVVAYIVFQVVRKLFFGELQVTETEHLSERAWHAIMETCLAFTVFRDDFSPHFVMQFVLLLFVKSFHWLSEDRVDYMERSPVITVTFHCRMMALLAFLSAFDSYFISHAYFTTLLRGASVQIVFGFEYAILMTIVLHVAIKYILHMQDLRNVHPWENKAVYLLYSELLINLLRCMLYVIFVAVMIRLHTFPLFSIRPLYLAVRAFHKAVNDVILSRRAIHAMNNLFPLATEQELLRGDNTCIICREEMTPVSGAKKLPCNHIFHANCLRSWFQRQQSCPTCRTDILVQRRPTNTIPHAAPVANDAAAMPNVVPQQRPENIGEMPNMFPFIAQFAFPRPQQQQPNLQQRAENIASRGTQQQTNGTQAPNASTYVDNMSQPSPFTGFPIMPFMMPPVIPLPPLPTFAGLSDAEVAAMESSERAAVEARINCLRNIGLLLDAATVQMQQYMSIVQSLSVSQLSSNHQISIPTNDATNPVVSRATTEGATSSFGETTVPPLVSTFKSSSFSSPAATSSSLNDAQNSDDPRTVTDSSTSAELTEIRQRRLEKFASASSSSNTNDQQ